MRTVSLCELQSVEGGLVIGPTPVALRIVAAIVSWLMQK